MSDKEVDYRHIFEQIAANYSTTVMEVQREIDIAIRAGLENPDPDIQVQWDKIQRVKEVPTPEELIAYILLQIENE